MAESRSARYYRTGSTVKGKGSPAKAKRAKAVKKKFDTSYQSSPTQKKNRAAVARATLEGEDNAARKKLGLKKGNPLDASHKVALSSGGSNAKSNLKAEARSKNRGRK